MQKIVVKKIAGTLLFLALAFLYGICVAYIFHGSPRWVFAVAGVLFGIIYGVVDKVRRNRASR